jgi:S1-C subfamily serine protease
MRRIHAILGTAVALTLISLSALGGEAGSHDDALGMPLIDSTRSIGPPTGTDKFSAASLHASKSFAPTRLNAVLSGLQADKIVTRGLAESRLYAKMSPGVVLIATNDALGSGSVLTQDGLILTNLHVVGNESTVAVVFKPAVEGAEIKKSDIHRGAVIRRDEVADLALIRVADAPANLTTIPLGTMDDISVGSDVHAIGHPTGEAWSYTKGVVSQVRRNYTWETDGLKHKASVIQTQTPINPGNSGGPLLTDDGTLIGVNSFKATGSEGLNFAVSVDDVRTLLDEKEDRLIRTSHSTNSSCTPKSYGVTRLKDGSGTRELLDIDCFGKPDAVWVLPDDLTEPGYLQVDPEHTGKITGILVSKNRDGKWNYSLWDTSGGGKPDLRCVHEDGSPTPTRCEKIPG